MTFPPVHCHPKYNKTPSSAKRDRESTKPKSYQTVFLVLLPSGNRTPGSRSYSDLVGIPGQTLFASTSSRSYSSLVQSLPVQWLIPINAHYLSGYTVAHGIHSG